jgi:hypothetical protein
VPAGTPAAKKKKKKKAFKMEHKDASGSQFRAASHLLKGAGWGYLGPSFFSPPPTVSFSFLKRRQFLNMHLVLWFELL